MRKLVRAALPLAAAASALTLTATSALAAVYESSAQFASYSTGGYTIYNDEYLCARGLWLNTLPEAPREVNDPLAAGPNWSRIVWNGRSYREPAGEPQTAATSLCT